MCGVDADDGHADNADGDVGVADDDDGNADDAWFNRIHNIESTQKRTAPPRKQTKRSTRAHTANPRHTHKHRKMHETRRKLYQINSNSIRRSTAAPIV